ncbi:MAG: SUMF1/EgtB/PvdO family nonheme iron enzyme, partial [Kiritimatiellae bacterium]|nr:SUMF1/EgtB/PvdO family nonheme iron enzyme [Kiritimatiellia bacterium]
MRFGSILVAALPVVALANPSVTITSVTQNFPWNGKVNIAYTVSGAEGEGSWAVSFTGKTGEGESFSLRTFAETPSAVNGSHVAVWDSAADGAQFSGGQAFVASAKLGRSDVTYDGEYMVIDVSGGREATSYPVSFAEASSTAAFNTDEYKTGKIVLKKVKAGTFLMGSPEDEEGRNKSLYNYPTGGPETQHYVKFEKDFYFSVFPVTCCQFTNVVAYAVEPWSADTCKPVNKQSYTDLRVDGGFFDVVNKKVSFDGSLLTGFHLPTESQWEYVCRAGTTTPYYFGESGDDFATYCGKWGTYAKVVGTLPANPWGFYDMLGGNFMMCQDRQGEYPLGTQDNPAVDPVHGNDTGYAIRRGYISGTESGWQETYFYRSACRNLIAEGTRNTSTSFQLAMTRTDVDKYEAKAVAEGVVFNTDVTKEDIADATVLLSSDELIYDGTEKKPTMTVTFGATDLKENTDYAVSYSDPVNAGTCMLTLTGLGH